MKIYLAARMSGVSQFNLPALDAAARNLRARGYEVVSPAELDDPVIRFHEMMSQTGDMEQLRKCLAREGIEVSWGEFLSRDIKVIADGGIEAVVVLPDWEKSRGARLETFVARLCGIPVLKYDRSAGYLNPVYEMDLRSAHGRLQESVYPSHVFDPPPSLVNCKARGAQLDREKILQNLIDKTNEVQADEMEDIASGFQISGESEEFCHTCEGPCVANAETVARETAEFFGETRVTNERTGGEKGRKLERFDLLPWAQLAEVARLYGKGAEKYEDRNWERGYAWSLSFGALHRHLAAFWGGEYEDVETECAHLASVVFHALALMFFHATHPDLDDRP